LVFLANFLVLLIVYFAIISGLCVIAYFVTKKFTLVVIIIIVGASWPLAEVAYMTYSLESSEFQKICKKKLGLKIYRTASKVKGIYWGIDSSCEPCFDGITKFGYKFIEFYVGNNMQEYYASPYVKKPSVFVKKKGKYRAEIVRNGDSRCANYYKYSSTSIKKILGDKCIVVYRISEQKSKYKIVFQEKFRKIGNSKLTTQAFSFVSADGKTIFAEDSRFFLRSPRTPIIRLLTPERVSRSIGEIKCPKDGNNFTTPLNATLTSVFVPEIEK